jgi:hypothetical protein
VISHKDVQASGLVDHIAHECPALIGSRDVTGQSVTSGLRFERRQRRRSLSCVREHVGAGVPKSRRMRQADTAGRTGDQRNLPAE